MKRVELMAHEEPARAQVAATESGFDHPFGLLVDQERSVLAQPMSGRDD
jgi:hypothetical protein